MVTQKQFKDHYNNLYNSRAIYVWGANGEIITKDLVDRLYRTYGSKTYTRAYYDAKLAEGKGKIGADCSGSIYPLSKADNSAKGYYRLCKTKGNIANLPKTTACLVFNANFTHVGAYMGDGTTIEMRSSKMNVYKENFNASRWAYYGIPTWLETTTPVTETAGTSAPTTSANTTTAYSKTDVIRNIQKWVNDYAGAGITVDGIAGPNTKKALVKALQLYLNRTQNAALSPDGIFGSKTKAACVTVKSGVSDLAYIAQALLFIKGYDMSKSIKGNKLDGNWGAGSEAATLEFQQNTYGLRHDGKCGPATFQKLCV